MTPPYMADVDLMGLEKLTVGLSMRLTSFPPRGRKIRKQLEKCLIVALIYFLEIFCYRVHVFAGEKEK